MDAKARAAACPATLARRYARTRVHVDSPPTPPPTHPTTPPPPPARVLQVRPTAKQIVRRLESLSAGPYSPNRDNELLLSQSLKPWRDHLVQQRASAQGAPSGAQQPTLRRSALTSACRSR